MAFAAFAMVVVAVVATVAGGFGAVGGGFAEVDRDGDFVDVLFDEGFDAMEFALFFLADESDGNAVCIGTGGASDAMDVVFRVVGHVVVDDEGDVVDVNAAGNDVGSDQDVDFPVFEIEHDVFALFLLQVGVHGCHIQALALQGIGEVFYFLL